MSFAIDRKRKSKREENEQRISEIIMRIVKYVYVLLKYYRIFCTQNKE